MNSKLVSLFCCLIMLVSFSGCTKVTQLVKDNQPTKADLLAEINEDAFAVQAAGAGTVIRETTTTETSTLFNAVSGGSKAVKELLDKDVISVVDIVITSADVHEVKDVETSPIISRPVVHFFTADGEHYSTLSNGIVRTTKNLLACGLVPTKETPIKIRFKEIETKKGIAHIFELA